MASWSKQSKSGENPLKSCGEFLEKYQREGGTERVMGKAVSGLGQHIIPMKSDPTLGFYTLPRYLGKL